jgi:RNA polymerase sigma-70 factor (ECF subfamily)
LNAFPAAIVYNTSMTSPAAAAWKDEVDDSALIAGVLAGDRRAGRDHYDRHAPRVYRLVYRMVADEDLAREFTQDTFVKAFSRLDSFRQECALATWLHAIAVSMVRSGMRRVVRWRNREAELVEAAELPALAPRSEPDLKERLAGALESLPEKFRTVVVLHDVEGYTHQEIAVMTGVPEGTCKTRLMNGRAKLREMLAAFATEFGR